MENGLSVLMKFRSVPTDEYPPPGTRTAIAGAWFALQGCRRASRGGSAPRRRFGVLLGALGFALAFLTAPVRAAEPEGELSDFIVSLVRYTVWPAQAIPPNRVLTICFTHGVGLEAPELDPGKDATVRGLTVRWRETRTPMELPGCSALWLDAEVQPAPKFWLAKIANSPVLTLSDHTDFTAEGGIIGAYRTGSEWRFEVNLEALRRSELSLAAAVLRLGQRPRYAATPGK